MGCTPRAPLAVAILLVAATSGCIVPEDMPALREELGYASVEERDLVVKIRASTQTPTVDEPVELTAETERVPADTVSFTWDVNGTTHEGPTLETSFPDPGVYPIQLEAEGPEGTQASDEIEIEAHPNTPPQPELTIEDADELWAEDPVVIRADGSTDPDGDTLAYTWQLDGKTLDADAVLETQLDAGPHHVELEVTDGYAPRTLEESFAVDRRIDHEANLTHDEPDDTVTAPLAESLEAAELVISHTTQAGLETVNLTLQDPDGEPVEAVQTDPTPGESQASARLEVDGERLSPGPHTLEVRLERGAEAMVTIEGVFMYSPLPSAPG